MERMEDWLDRWVLCNGPVQLNVADAEKVEAVNACSRRGNGKPSHSQSFDAFGRWQICTFYRVMMLSLVTTFMGMIDAPVQVRGN